MQAIKNEAGQIIYYMDWQMNRTPAKDVFNNILSIQGEQIKEWKPKLNSKLYKDLILAVTIANQGLTPETHNAYDCIKRGCQISSFINNWKPGKKLSEIYW